MNDRPAADGESTTKRRKTDTESEDFPGQVIVVVEMDWGEYQLQASRGAPVPKKLFDLLVRANNDPQLNGNVARLMIAMYRGWQQNLDQTTRHTLNTHIERIMADCGIGHWDPSIIGVWRPIGFMTMCRETDEGLTLIVNLTLPRHAEDIGILYEDSPDARGIKG